MSWLIILAIIVVNSMFVVAEVSLLTSRHIRLERLAQQGSKGANTALQIIREPDKFLSTVQIGITLMSIILGLYGGATVGDNLVETFEDIPYLKPYSYALSNGIMVIFITYLTVMGEIIPKRIAMLYPEKLAIISSYTMVVLMRICYPLITTLSLSTRLVIKMLGLRSTPHELTVDEIKIFINQAENSGTVEKTERDMIRRLIHLSDMAVGAVMTPRNKMVCLDLNESDAQILHKLYTHPFNTFPVTDGEDNIIGTVSTKELLNAKMQDKPLLLKKKLKPVLYIPETARLDKLIELMKLKQSRIAIIIDEYGETEGIVTLNDIVKTFVGDLATLIDGQKPNIISRRDGSYMVAGSTPVAEIMEILDLNSLPGAEEEEYRTLASFILKQMNKVPKAGDHFTAAGWQFKVTRMDNFRIDRVLISPIIED